MSDLSSHWLSRTNAPLVCEPQSHAGFWTIPHQTGTGQRGRNQTWAPPGPPCPGHSRTGHCRSKSTFGRRVPEATFFKSTFHSGINILEDARTWGQWIFRETWIFRESPRHWCELCDHHRASEALSRICKSLAEIWSRCRGTFGGHCPQRSGNTTGD